MHTPVLPQRQPGYTDPVTGRVAVAVADLAESDLNGDITAYWHDGNAELFGLDPWATVVGIDTLVDGSGFDVWFVNGGLRAVAGDALVYLRWHDAQRLAGGKNNRKVST